MKNVIADEKLRERKVPRIADIRGDFFRDQTAIIHSMPFRRLKHKTQVFFSPKNDHICTRIEHVQHVATIAATICKGLSKSGWELDSELAYAIGLGHDLGHAPFGHAGETALTKCIGKQFMHELNSYRVTNTLANDGKGLNLTFAVNDGIICHNGELFEKSIEPDNQVHDLDKIINRKNVPNTWEGCIVRFSDKIAYLGRDIEDAIVAKIIDKEDVPERLRHELGNNNGEIINNLILDLIEASSIQGKISFSEEKYQLMNELKTFNYEKIYKHEKLANYIVFVDRMIITIYEHLKRLFCMYGFDFHGYEKEKLEISNSFGHYLSKMKDIYIDDRNVPNQILSDYISGMTDSYAIDAMKQLSIPREL
jgi:dGTPase